MASDESGIGELVRRIHASPTQTVLAVTGGGSRAISALLEVPGASRTVLEAVVPYTGAALTAWLHAPPEHACSPRTARAMAMEAFHRARQYVSPHDGSGTAPIAGIGCTASLASDRAKRGAHRLHAAWQTASTTSYWSLNLSKGRRSRAEEEWLTTQLLLNVVAEACALEDRLEVPLLLGEQIETTRVEAPQAWQELLSGAVQIVRGTGGQWNAVREGSIRESEQNQTVVFPGAFNPVHEGHRLMAEVAQEVTGKPVQFELSIVNVDKPALDFLEIRGRVDQFSGEEVMLTRAPTFVEKSRLLPGATFVVGSDTIVRIADPRYYAGDERAMMKAVEEMAQRGCRFLVFGRAIGESYRGLADVPLPEALRKICTEIDEQAFRADISSTELRRSKKPVADGAEDA